MAACFGHSDTDDGRLELRDRITIGAHAVLTGSFQVLDDPRISPYSVLRNEVPEYSIVASSALRMRLKRRLDERLEH